MVVLSVPRCSDLFAQGFKSKHFSLSRSYKEIKNRVLFQSNYINNHIKLIATKLNS